MTESTDLRTETDATTLQIRRHGSPDRKESIDAKDNAHVQNQRVDISERTLSIIAFGFAIAAFVIAIGGVLWNSHDRQNDQRVADVQVRQQYREIDRLVREVHVHTVTLENHDAEMIRAGIQQPGDAARGPTGNLHYKPEEK